MKFNDLYRRVEEVSSSTAFNEDEAILLYDTLHSLDKGSRVVEIGLEYGRSTTIFAEIARIKQMTHLAIDNFSQADGEKYKDILYKRKKKYFWTNTRIINNDSSTEARKQKGMFDLIFIDGDHSYEGVRKDIDAWLPKLKKEHLILFHDYNRPSLPEIKKAVDETKEIELLDKVNYLGVFKKL